MRENSNRRRSNRSQKSSTSTPTRRGAASRFPVGVVGLGLMGSSIATCLLAAGHRVIGMDIDPRKSRAAKAKMLGFLRELKSEGLLRSQPAQVIKQLQISTRYPDLADCELVVESTVESFDVKRQVLRSIEDAVSPNALIGTNTSAIPVTLLQQGTSHPERILGLHWAEPAHITQFMEIICGDHTSSEAAERAMQLAEGWDKEPSLLRRDIRGFLTNRMFYAMLREAFHLVESGYASVADVDRSLRNDLGWWITFAGPFRFMDITGIPAYAAVMRDLFPDLSCETRVPELISKLVDSGARGTANAKGFYPYTPAEARRWDKDFIKFSYEIRKLSRKYSERTRFKRKTA